MLRFGLPECTDVTKPPEIKLDDERESLMLLLDTLESFVSIEARFSLPMNELERCPATLVLADKYAVAELWQVIIWLHRSLRAYCVATCGRWELPVRRIGEDRDLIIFKTFELIAMLEGQTRVNTEGAQFGGLDGWRSLRDLKDKLGNNGLKWLEQKKRTEEISDREEPSYTNGAVHGSDWDQSFTMAGPAGPVTVPSYSSLS